VCFQKPAFVRAVYSQTTCFPGLSQQTFTVVFLPAPCVEIEEKILVGGGAMSLFCEALQPPGQVGIFLSSTLPWKRWGKTGSSRHGSIGLEISPKGEWTFMATPKRDMAQRVPNTPQTTPDRLISLLD